jgi:hypothetical protein
MFQLSTAVGSRVNFTVGCKYHIYTARPDRNSGCGAGIGYLSPCVSMFAIA